MKRAAIVVLILASVLVGALAAGTPVNGNKSTAATTAGIELGVPGHAPPRVDVAPVADLPAQHVVVLLLLLAAVAIGHRSTAPILAKARSVLRAQGTARRGPPALA